ncbi:MAG: hypothetical protein ACREQ2_04925 [Candidatus Binatia bacterium]
MDENKTGRDIEEGVKPYEPTELERNALEAHSGRVKGQSPAPRLKTWVKDNVAQVAVDHPSGSHGQALLMEALATTDTDFLVGIVSQLGNAGSLGQNVDEQALNVLLSVVKGIQPKDQLETMLAAQMAAVHSLTMNYARRLANAGSMPQQESAERALNKLARTFAAQVEALKRYRTGGEQKVTVEHVTVNEGGQAIVGNVSNSPARGVGASENG